MTGGTLPAKDNISGETSMPHPSSSRRQFLVTSSGALAGTTLLAGGYFSQLPAQDDKPRSANERLRIGTIGLRYQGTVITVQARQYGDIVALCDVDRHVREQARSSFGSTPRIYEDYRDLIAQKDLDVILIGTPDHWHVKWPPTPAGPARTSTGRSPGR